MVYNSLLILNILEMCGLWQHAIADWGLMGAEPHIVHLESTRVGKSWYGIYCLNSSCPEGWHFHQAFDPDLFPDYSNHFKLQQHMCEIKFLFFQIFSMLRLYLLLNIHCFCLETFFWSYNLPLFGVIQNYQQCCRINGILIYYSKLG